MMKLTIAGLVFSGAGIPLATTLPIDNTTPPLIALSIIFLVFLYIFAKLAGEVIKEMARHNSAQEHLAVAMTANNVQQAESNKRLDELCEKLGNKPCIADDQNVVENMARRITDQLSHGHLHVRSSDT